MITQAEMLQALAKVKAVVQDMPEHDASLDEAVLFTIESFELRSELADLFAAAMGKGGRGPNIVVWSQMNKHTREQVLDVIERMQAKLMGKRKGVKCE